MLNISVVNVDAQPTVPQRWCSISYYEMDRRLGEIFHGSASVLTVDGFTSSSIASSERFSLGYITDISRSRDIEMTRTCIGKGVRLRYTYGEVSVECLSDSSIFVQSPSYNQHHRMHPETVCEIRTGYSLIIFRNGEFAELLDKSVLMGFDAAYSLIRMCTIRMSFVQGWGETYPTPRPTVAHTPCWIELRLNDPLKWLDVSLRNMTQPGPCSEW